MNNEPVAWMHKTYFQDGLYEEDLVWSKIDESSIPLYTHPAKNKHLSLQKVDGELVAVTYTDDEHRIIEVLWEKPPAKTLTGLTAKERKAIWIGIWGHYSCPSVDDIFAEIEEAILRKAQEKC